MSKPRKDFGCAGFTSESPNGTEHDSGHEFGGEITCEQCRFCAPNKGKGFDPRYPMGHVRNWQAQKDQESWRAMR